MGSGGDAPRLQEAAAAGHRDIQVAAAQPGQGQDVVADGRGGQVLVGGVDAFVAQRRGGEGKGAVFRKRFDWGARSAAAQAARRRRLHEVGVKAERSGRQRDEAVRIGLAGSGRRRRWGRAAGQEQGQQEVKGGTQSRRLHTGGIVGSDGRVDSVRKDTFFYYFRSLFWCTRHEISPS